ncbi:uncharacterized protein LOC113295268 [Papaver somniferum]|uniref:uncharacterized protein LOC113295268 n=1 Tax=Papaver somniferum TaxID=3469 RepID=UPI000E700C61|nr:uncharacterized protein LOC113295268 [Papaver somniferum]
MVPLKTPLTKKECFVLYHDDILCKEIRSSIYVRAMLVPSPRTTHVVVTRMPSKKGDNSGVSGPSNARPARVVSNGSSSPTAFSVGLKPVGSLGNGGSSIYGPAMSSVLRAISSLTIKEPVNKVTPSATITPSSGNISFNVSPFDNLTFGPDGLVHDRKGKRPRTSFESESISTTSFSSSASLKSLTHWPAISSLPLFNPPTDTSFNVGSLGVSSSNGSPETNVFWSASCT